MVRQLCFFLVILCLKSPVTHARNLRVNVSLAPGYGGKKPNLFSELATGDKIKKYEGSSLTQEERELLAKQRFRQTRSDDQKQTTQIGKEVTSSFGAFLQKPTKEGWDNGRWGEIFNHWVKEDLIAAQWETLLDVGECTDQKFREHLKNFIISKWGKGDKSFFSPKTNVLTAVKARRVLSMFDVVERINGVSTVKDYRPQFLAVRPPQTVHINGGMKHYSKVWDKEKGLFRGHQVDLKYDYKFKVSTMELFPDSTDLGKEEKYPTYLFKVAPRIKDHADFFFMSYGNKKVNIKDYIQQTSASKACRYSTEFFISSHNQIAPWYNDGIASENKKTYDNFIFHMNRHNSLYVAPEVHVPSVLRVDEEEDKIAGDAGEKEADVDPEAMEAVRKRILDVYPKYPVDGMSYDELSSAADDIEKDQRAKEMRKVQQQAMAQFGANDNYFFDSGLV